MNRKSVLQMMELLIMVLVFAISACVCVRCFVHADQLSKKQENKTAAVLVAQNAAELLKSTSGDMEKAADEMGGFCDGNSWCMPMDASWNVIGEREQAVYLLEVTREAQGELPVGAALLRVTAAGETLVEIRVAWQEGN